MIGLCVLPSLRLNRLAREVEEITDHKTARRVMDAVERHLEQGAHRWGNVCALPECGQLLLWNEQRGFGCDEHGWLGRHTATKLLVAFDPIVSPEDQS